MIDMYNLWRKQIEYTNVVFGYLVINYYVLLFGLYLKTNY